MNSGGTVYSVWVSEDQKVRLTARAAVECRSVCSILRSSAMQYLDATDEKLVKFARFVANQDVGHFEAHRRLKK